MTKKDSDKRKLIGLFQRWQDGALDKWDVYVEARHMMDRRLVKLSDVIEVAYNVCRIPEGVVKMRMRYMKQLGDQVTRSYETLKAAGVICKS